VNLPSTAITWPVMRAALAIVIRSSGWSCWYSSDLACEHLTLWDVALQI
jgi:hypothetical protein